MISVCIATYNGEKYIQDQLRSILDQLNEEDEIIISDANSTDRTVELINTFNDNRIKLVFFNKNKIQGNKHSIFLTMDNVKNNFQNALKYIKGDIIFLSDQDDIWYKNKIKRVCKELINASCVIHDCAVISDEKIIIPSFLKYFKPSRTKWGMFLKSPFMGCCMAFNRNVLERALPFPKLHIEHDTWIGMCAHKTGKVLILDEILMDYRRHGQNASLCTDEKENSIYIKLLRRMYMIYAYLRY